MRPAAEAAAGSARGFAGRGSRPGRTRAGRTTEHHRHFASAGLEPHPRTSPAVAETQPTESASAPHTWSLAALGERTAPTAVSGRGLRATRAVGDNPILWREVRTWAYGRKVVFIRLVFALLCGAAGWALWSTARERTPTSAETVPLIVLPAVVAALLINMQAVTAITASVMPRARLVARHRPDTEGIRLRQLAGIAYNARGDSAALLLCIVLWRTGAANGESAVLLALGWLSAAAFAAMLGLHVGLHDAESRRAAAVSLGTIFFLVVGIAVSMRIMVAFSARSKRSCNRS